MKLKLLTLLICLSFASLIKSQGFALNLGYDYIGKSAGFVGVDYRISPNRKSYSNIGVGTYLTTNNQKFTAIPEVHYNYNFKEGYKAELSLCTKKITPSVGINLFNAMHLNLGYNIPFNKEEDFKGPYVGLHFFLGERRFYYNMKLF